MSHSPAFLKIVDENRKKITELSVQEVFEKMQKKENFILVDVREESEWAQGRIEGAMYLGKGVIERDIEAEIPDKNAKIVLYCGGGFRSVLSAVNLKEMGYTNVISMDGGYRSWKECGFPTE